MSCSTIDKTDTDSNTCTNTDTRQVTRKKSEIEGNRIDEGRGKIIVVSRSMISTCTTDGFVAPATSSSLDQG